MATVRGQQERQQGQWHALKQLQLEGIAALEQLFPSYKKESLLQLLTENDLSVERTIETIFSIESAKENLEQIADISIRSGEQRFESIQIRVCWIVYDE